MYINKFLHLHGDKVWKIDSKVSNFKLRKKKLEIFYAKNISNIKRQIKL